MLDILQVSLHNILYVCMCVYVSGLICISAYTCTILYTSLCVSARSLVCECVCTCVLCVYLYYAYRYIYIYITFLNKQICVYACTFAHMYVIIIYKIYIAPYIICNEIALKLQRIYFIYIQKRIALFS